MRFVFWGLCILSAIGVSAQKDNVVIKPRPAWVKEHAYSDILKDTANTSGGYYYLLYEDQYNTILKESYHHVAQMILSQKGLENISSISIDYDPSYETLVFHTLESSGPEERSINC